ncbi:MAG: hypothetical protein GYA59_06490, partial [Chloroflexi bacterium]|nr:hypothetical protein [Chloroflexota bacterium]
MRLTTRPYLFSAVLLLILLLLSVAIGNAIIPPNTILQLVAARLQHAGLAAGPLTPLDAILFDLR